MPYLLWLWAICFGLPLQCRCCGCWWSSDDADTHADRCGGEPEPRWRWTGSGCWLSRRNSSGISTFCWPASVGGLKKRKKEDKWWRHSVEGSFPLGKKTLGRFKETLTGYLEIELNWSKSPLQQHQPHFLPPLHKLWTPVVEFLLFLKIISRERHESTAVT